MVFGSNRVILGHFWVFLVFFGLFWSFLVFLGLFGSFLIFFSYSRDIFAKRPVREKE